MRLAEPVAVVAGEPSLPDRFARRGPIPSDEVDAYVAELRESGKVHEVEARYGDLKVTLRRLVRDADR